MLCAFLIILRHWFATDSHMLTSLIHLWTNANELSIVCSLVTSTPVL